MSIASEITRISNEVSTQTDLLEQIKTALQGKAASNGEYTPIQEKTINVTDNGTVEVTPDDGYVLSKVTANVNVPIPAGHVKPSGTLNVTTNGAHDVTNYESVNVDVAGSGGIETCTLTVIVGSNVLDVATIKAIVAGEFYSDIKTYGPGDVFVIRNIHCNSMFYMFTAKSIPDGSIAISGDADVVTVHEVDFFHIRGSQGGNYTITVDYIEETWGGWG